MGQLEDMDAFVRIVEAGSISQAATQLGVVKSAVSRRLVDLETRLGVQLLNRTTRQSSLTEAGRNYYERSLSVLNEVAEINASTSGSQVKLTGTLKISAPLSFGLQHMTAAITEFMELHPDLIVHIDFNDRQVALVEEGFDLAIRIADLKDSTLIARKLAPTRKILCASPDYIKKHGAPQKAEDLKSHNILHYDNSDRNTWHFFDPEGRKTSVTLPTKMITNSGDFLMAATLRGHGIILIPTFIVWKELQSGALISVMGDYHFPGYNANAVYPHTRYLPQKVRAFIDLLKTKFGTEPYWDRAINEK